MRTPAVMNTRPTTPKTLARRIGRAYRAGLSAPEVRRLGGLWPRSVASTGPMDQVVHLRSTVALTGIDLDLLRGEIVLLRGPNGAGKTTLLRVLAGLVPPVRGEARVLGHSLPAEARAVRRRVGLLGHATALFEELTAADNVGFWGRACRASHDEIEGALGLVGLDGRLRDVAVSRLSAGHRRRRTPACLPARP